MAGKFQVVLATDLEDEELEDLKILCILRDQSIRQLTSSLVRKELKLRQEMILLGRKSLPGKKSLKEYLLEKFPLRGNGGHKPLSERLLDMTTLGDLYD